MGAVPKYGVSSIFMTSDIKFFTYIMPDNEIKLILHSLQWVLVIYLPDEIHTTFAVVINGPY